MRIWYLETSTVAILCLFAIVMAFLPLRPGYIPELKRWRCVNVKSRLANPAVLLCWSWGGSARNGTAPPVLTIRAHGLSAAWPLCSEAARQPGGIDESRHLRQSEHVEQRLLESFPFHGLCRGMLPVYMSGWARSTWLKYATPSNRYTAGGTADGGQLFAR